MNNMRIMIIDDDQGHLTSLEDALSLNDYDVQAFLNPIEAVEVYKSENFDVVITDYKMPQMDGIQVLKAVKKFNPDAYVLIMTGFANKDNAIDAVNHGAYFFFRKPIDLRRVYSTLEKIENEIRERREELSLIAFAKEYKKLKGLLQSFDQIKNEISTLHGDKHEK